MSFEDASTVFPLLSNATTLYTSPLSLGTSIFNESPAAAPAPPLDPIVIVDELEDKVTFVPALRLLNSNTLLLVLENIP